MTLTNNHLTTDQFTKETTAIFYNLKPVPIQLMLDFDFLSKRKPSVVAIIHPGKQGIHKAFYGGKEILIPIYQTIEEATAKHPAEVMINFASFRSAYHATLAGLETTIQTVAIVAEGLPERQTQHLIALSKKLGKTIIGPATVGGIVAGKFRIGHAGGLVENIIKAKLYRPGCVGLVSKSGGLMNEMFHIISRASNGIYEGIAIGGDVFPGTTLLDHILRYESNPEIKMIVAMSELGGNEEYDIIQAKKEGKINKPMVMWVAGTSADIFPWEVQFGHAGAKSGRKEESAQAKNQALREAGIIVPKSFAQLEPSIKQTYDQLNLPITLDHDPPIIPGRRKTHITSTISSDLGELTYHEVPISKVLSEKNIGDVISLLWFKKQLPRYATTFFEKCIMLTADHGPAVAGAHNAIVAARAGKDMISSLCSGLLTIGPRFGGAIDAACRTLHEAITKGMDPATFVSTMKNENQIIPGIGHRTKSKSNPDKRVEILIKLSGTFPTRKYLDFALAVEQETLKKSEKLILNVDGCIAAMFLDLIASEFSPQEQDEIILLGYMNGLFALSRSIGIIGHILDQKRLNEPLYRHPVEDINYQAQ